MLTHPISVCNVNKEREIKKIRNIPGPGKIKLNHIYNFLNYDFKAFVIISKV